VQAEVDASSCNISAVEVTLMPALPPGLPLPTLTGPPSKRPHPGDDSHPCEDQGHPDNSSTLDRNMHIDKQPQIVETGQSDDNHEQADGETMAVDQLPTAVCAHTECIPSSPHNSPYPLTVEHLKGATSPTDFCGVQRVMMGVFNLWPNIVPSFLFLMYLCLSSLFSLLSHLCYPLL
jgi:hypothetical protein